MGNTPFWLSKWGRSPRQDRRVVENGRFVEQGQVQLPEPPPVEVPEQEQSALEIVQETTAVPVQEQVVDKETVARAVEELKTPEGAQAFVKAFNDSINDPSHLTEEQSDALAETLRLPESTDDSLPF